MDVSSLKVAATGVIHVKNAAGEPLYEGDTPVQITVHSPGSRPYSVIDTRQTTRALKRMNDNEGKMTAPTAEERLKETAEDLATITVSFNGLTDGDKTGTELFESVYGNRELGFIAAQVQKFVKDWANFQIGSVVT